MKTTTILPALLLLSLPAVFAEEPERKKPIEKDLVLSAKLETKNTIQPGEEIGIALSLTNSSKSATHRVIRPGDGSFAGWREPHVHFSVQHLDANGQWTDAPETHYSRCGNFDADWTKDYVDLAPGATLKLNHWPTPVEQYYEFQEPGKYRIRALYDYTARPLLPKDKAKLPPAVKTMPVFRVSSAPLAITVERPLDLRLKVKRDLKVKEQPLSDLFELTLVNESEEEIEVSSRHNILFRVEMKGVHGPVYSGWRPIISRQSDKNRKSHPESKSRTLKPKEELSLLGDTESANGLDGIWVYSSIQDVRVRAAYVYSCWDPYRHSLIQSKWVELKADRNR